MKKLLWTALVSLASAAAAALAARAAERLWRMLAKEPPPGSPRWARYLVGKPLHSQIKRRIPHPETT